MRDFLKMFILGLGFLLTLQGCLDSGLPVENLPSIKDEEGDVGGGDDGGTNEEPEPEPVSSVWQVDDFKTTNNEAWVSTCAVMGDSWLRYIFIVDTRMKIWGISYASEASCLSHSDGSILVNFDYALPYVVPVQMGSDTNTQFNNTSTGTFLGMETEDTQLEDFIFWGKATSDRNRIVIAIGQGFLDGSGGISYATLNGSSVKDVVFEDVTASDISQALLLLDRVSNININDYGTVQE
nr:hypothetical protein BdHM001_17180 [Bdellovibrio sp. HM001]